MNTYKNPRGCPRGTLSRNEATIDQIAASPAFPFEARHPSV